jgi:hypothetical protein
MLRIDAIDQASAEWAFDPAPCELCPNAARCRVQLEACDQFVIFSRSGGRRWRSEARLPSRKLFDQIFRETAVARRRA